MQTDFCLSTRFAFNLYMGIIELRPSTIKSIPLFHQLKYNKPAKTSKATEEDEEK